MIRPTRDELDALILDHAAALFARHGFKQTSIQAIADTVGYSKAGLLHRFPSKEAIEDAVVERCISKVETIAASFADQPLGAARDRNVVEAIVDLAHNNPGVATLALNVVSFQPDPVITERLEPLPRLVFEAFGANIDEPDHDRNLRIGAALGGLIVLTLGVTQHGEFTAVRDHLITISLNTLGHNAVAPNA